LKSSTKAALLSCFVFPGAGHWYLKRYMLALMLFFGAAAAVYFIASSAFDTALKVAEQIQSGGIPLDVQSIAELVSQQTRTSVESTNSAFIALIALWFIGIFDSYRVGRAIDNAPGGAGEKET